MEILEEYLNRFIAFDGVKRENSRLGAFTEFLKENLPVFTCDDKTLEEIYYFRAYTFMKHLKRMADGRYIVTEFLPDVPWATEGAISCAVGHHLRELRWLKNGFEIARDYISFWCEHPEALLLYNNWFLYAVWEYCDFTGHMDFAYEKAEDFIGYFTRFRDMHAANCGLYKSFDNYDGMEFSVSAYGIRPTINSYVYGNAYGLYKILDYAGDLRAGEYGEFAAKLKEKIANELYRDGFYYTLPLENGEKVPRLIPDFCNPMPDYSVKEQIGYVPFYFGIPKKEQYGMWKYVVDEKVFLAPYGLTTVDRSSRSFGYYSPHMCLWNGPVWPFATSQTLTGLSNALKTRNLMPIGKAEYTFLLKQYASSQHIRTENGVRPWIDENLDGETGEWLARKIMMKNNASDRERGVDYNHSTYFDLILNGLCGADVKDGVALFEPQAEGVAFTVEGLNMRGKEYRLLFDGTSFTKEIR